jgi:hypothetical protein
MSLTAARIAQIAATHRSLPMISLIYTEKYVSVQSHRHNIKTANDIEIGLIFIGIKFFIDFFSISF